MRDIYLKKKNIQKHTSLALSAAGSSAKRSANQALIKTEQMLSGYIPVDTKEIIETAKEINCGVAKKPHLCFLH